MSNRKINDALIVVDVQNDFVTGNLAVPGATAIIPGINARIKEFEADRDLVIYTKDWHQKNHNSFQGHGGFWPPHCVMFTEGAELACYHSPQGRVFAKGIEDESYSGFEYINGKCSLANILNIWGVTDVFICGLATDYCVKHTALDAVKLGYKTWLYTDLVAGVGKKETEQALAEMREAGVNFI